MNTFKDLMNWAKKTTTTIGRITNILERHDQEIKELQKEMTWLKTEKEKEDER